MSNSNDTPRSPSVTRSTSDLRDRARQLRDRLPERRQAKPPPETGRRLATLSRPRDDDEIRITRSEFEGNPYVGVRFWRRDDSGQFWPDKHRGFSIRLHELADVAEAIAAAIDLAEEHLGSRSRRRPERQAGDGRRPSCPPSLPGMSAEPFDEFDREGGGQ
jgi:hypothetical protein